MEDNRLRKRGWKLATSWTSYLQRSTSSQTSGIANLCARGSTLMCNAHATVQLIIASVVEGSTHASGLT